MFSILLPSQIYHYLSHPFLLQHIQLHLSLHLKAARRVLTFYSPIRLLSVPTMKQIEV